MCRFITCFVTVFATAIAITKDLPDVEGDRKHNIDTFATRVGTSAVARVGEPTAPYLAACALSGMTVQYHAGTWQWYGMCLLAC